jgi:RimJ/RimL family protein N-acetyltransferase
MRAPVEFRTPRLLIRRWHASDAVELAPILATNVDHLAPWIPWRVAEPAPPAQLATRLEEFAAAFDTDREWRYGLFAAESGRILGDVGLFPRNESGRVALDAADHVEIGYWLRADATGRGYATEAARAALEIARSLPGMSRVMIRCDERNIASAAIPRRLGFRLVMTVLESGVRAEEPECRLQVWEYALDMLAHAS